MQETWNNGKPHYRCRYPAEYAEPNNRHPKSVYVREGIVIPAVDRWLSTLFEEEHVDSTIDAMAGSLKSNRHDEATVTARRAIARCDARLASYRAALDPGADPATIAK